jgi:hypothetical protein
LQEGKHADARKIAAFLDEIGEPRYLFTKQRVLHSKQMPKPPSREERVQVRVQGVQEPVLSSRKNGTKDAADNEGVEADSIRQSHWDGSALVAATGN